MVAPLRADAAVVYAVWRERVDVSDSGGVGDEPVHDGIAGTGLADSDVVAGGTYRYAVSVANEGYDNSSLPGEPVTVEVPGLLGDADPGVARFTVGDADPVVLEPDARRRDVAVDSAGGHTTVSFEANAFDALLAAQTIRADLFTVGDQDLARPVYLSERGDTLVIVSVQSPDRTQQQAYTVRLRPPVVAGSGGGNVAKFEFGSRFGPGWSRGPVAELRARSSGTAAPSLNALALSSGTLGPAFAAATLDYIAAVAHDVDEVTVAYAAAPGTTAMVVAPDADPGAAGHQVALNASTRHKPAQTVIVIAVSNSDGRLDSYTVTVTRAVVPASDDEALSDPLSDDVSLAALSLSDGDLSPAFDTATNAYSTSVPASTGWVTVTAEATFDGAQADISPTDANPLQAGHQIDLAASPDGAADGSTNIDVTVTAEDQTTTGTYRVTVTRPPATSFRGTARVINTTSMGLGWIKSLWSDGRTLFVANVHSPFHRPGDIYKIDIATGERAGRLMLIERNEGLPYSPYITDYSTDVWSDGESMWVLDRWGAVARHDLVDGEDYVLVQSQDEIEVAFDSVAEFRPPGVLDSTRTDPPSYSFGIWSDGEIMWVSNAGEHTTKVRAFTLATGEPVPDRDIAIQVPADPHLNWGNYGVQDIWSDGTTMWVVYRTPRLARAYDLDTGDRRSHLDIDIAEVDGRIGNPRGLWSDGGMMWFTSFYIPPNSHPLISDGNPPSRIFGFYLPTEAALASLSVSDADIGSFSPWDTSYTATVVGTTETVTVEAAAQHDDASVVILPADADPDAEGHQVSLNTGDNTITVTSGTYNHTMTYTVTITR